MDNLKMFFRAAERVPDPASQQLSSLLRQQRLALNCVRGNCTYNSYVVSPFTTVEGAVLPLLGFPVEANTRFIRKWKVKLGWPLNGWNSQPWNLHWNHHPGDGV